MLQPEPAGPQPQVTRQSVEQPSGAGVQHSQHGTGSPVPPKRGFWQLITFKEIVFVFLLCSSGALLFRSKDRIKFVTVWKEKIITDHFANMKFPVEDEKMPRPVITDMNSDGNMDILMFTSRTLLKLVTVSSAKNAYKPPEEQHVLEEEGWADMIDFGASESVRPAAMATGYLQKYQSMVQVRKQVVAVLLSDWTVLCFDHSLRLLWKTKVGENPVESWGLSISEAAILVTSVGIQKGDYGSVIVGGREVDPDSIEQSVDRLRRVVNEKNEERMLSSLGHYTVYALEGRGGVIRWQHTPTDFQETQAYTTEHSSFHHMKLFLHRESKHAGEVSWRQYSSAIRDTMPHSWQHSMDTHFTLAHFKKDQRPSEKSELKDHVTKVGGLAVDHMSGLAFGGHPPHSVTEHVQDPNVLVLHSVTGIGVMHLFQGRPLCTLYLSPYHSAHLDINGDGIIDQVSAVHNPGEFGGPHGEEGESEVDCYGVASPMDSRPLFKHSICKATHWTEAFVNTDKWIPNLSKVGRKKVNHQLTETLAPVLIPSTYHSNPLKLHMGAPGWDLNSVFQSVMGSPKPFHRPSLSSFVSPAARLYDSIFVLSSGRVTSIGPHGEFNWQVDCQSDWDVVSEVIYNPTHSWWHEKPEMIQLIQGAFVPSAMGFSFQVNGKEDHILVMGWDTLSVLSAEDGVPVTSVQFDGCNPVAPVQVEDFNGDGWNDVILVCQDRYWGIALHRKSGFWNKTLISAFIGVVLVAVAMYTRQRTVGLLPPIKSD